MHFEENKTFCDTTHLTKGAKIYYQWDCNSTWLTFENKEKIILKSCPDIDPVLCSRLGLNFMKEYSSYFLFKHDWISSCGSPPDLVFINKENGKELKRISNELFLWGNLEDNYTFLTLVIVS